MSTRLTGVPDPPDLTGTSPARSVWEKGEAFVRNQDETVVVREGVIEGC